MRTIVHPDGRTIKLGRKRPVALGPRLHLKNYLDTFGGEVVPAPPPSCDYSPKADSVLHAMYGNDQLGDCVIAGGYHVVGVLTGNADDLFTATPDQIIKDYSAIGGYVPGNPSTDQGCDEPTALNYWTEHGFADGSRLLGWLAIDSESEQETKSAVYLFENLILCFDLPDEYINPFPSGDGFTWDVAGEPNPQNGHCVIVYGYDDKGLLIVTWGMKGHMTWAARAKYINAASGGAQYAVISPDQLPRGQTRVPNGVDWSALITDFDMMGGTVPVPPEEPPPPPPPPPVILAVTSAQAIAWAIDPRNFNIAATGRIHPITQVQQSQIANNIAANIRKHWSKA